MNKTLRVSLIVIIILVGSVALVWTGYRFGRASAWTADGYSYSGMMNYNDRNSRFDYDMGSGMMSGSDFGMMGPGMMDGSGYGMMDGFQSGRSMMGGFGSTYSGEPISVDDARDAVASYLIQFDNEDLVVEEIMIFDNNAYAIVIEESTGIGAFELLVDPLSKTVFPEFGPNMMWNQKYGMMGSGMMGSGMMDGFYNNGATAGEFDAEMAISAEEALEIAQEYLNQAYPGIDVSDEITQFYGYYTIDTESDGEIAGMLSVNGFSGQVFPHVWHGEFIEMVEG
jgi:hypothetical protein